MWLETHQGTGLMGFMPAAGRRLLPVLSHPEAAMELEVLWQLCSQWQHQGYPVLVLDATAAETAAAPGLAQWLAAQACPAGVHGAQELTIIPAAGGVQRLVAAGGPQALERLEPVLHGFAAVVLYAAPAAVAALLQGQAASPLVIAAPGDAALLRSYLLLKQMAQHDARACTVAAVVPPGGRPQAAERALQALRQGCAQWLGASPRTVTVNAGDAQGLQALALQLLESACLMTTARDGLPSRAPSHTAWPHHAHGEH